MLKVYLDAETGGIACIQNMSNFCLLWSHLQYERFVYTSHILYFFLMADRIFILSSLILSFSLTFLMMPYGISLLVRYKMGKQIREEALIGKAEEFSRLHQGKTGTPTMGGAMIIISVLIITLLSIWVQYMGPWMESILGFSFKYSLWNRNETYIVLFTLVSVGCIGFIDDYLNIRGIGRTKWLSARIKMILLILFWLVWAYWFYGKLGYSSIHIPLFGAVSIGYLYIPLFIFVLVATANSVNITDGLDGLAGGLLLFCYTIYAVIAYTKGLFILTAFCLIIVGALIAFLWFNIKPAKVFLGDVGSLSLGATLAVIAFMTDTLLVLLIAGGIFIFETLSVIVQLLSKKYRNGKKIFRIAPFHHHLEAIGWKEETIVMRFWLIGMILSVTALTFGFIR